MADGGNNIDNLSFGIILKDEDFKRKMNEVKTMAEKFSKDVEKALDLTKALDKAQGGSAKETKKDADATTQKVKKQKQIVTLTRQELEAKKAAGIATKAELLQLNAYLRSEKLLLDEQKKKVQLQKEQVALQRQQNLLHRSTSKDIKLTSNQLLQQNAIMKGLTSMAASYFSVFGAVSVVRNLVRITGEFEAQHTALRAILQDNAAADNIYNQLQVLAVKSPFTFQNLVGYAKQLTAFSVPVNEVYETTKKLADVSAGLGIDMGRIILAYGQVRSAEFLRGQEVRQFTEAGIPILKELADQIQEMEGHAVSVGEVFDRISARQIPFAMVEEAFNRMTSAGGKFYQMQEVLAETVKGKVSNLQDAWEIMLSKIGDENSGTIKGIVNSLTNLFANYEKWIGLLGGVIRYIGLYAAGMAFVNTVTKAHNAIQLVTNGLHIVRNQQIKIWNALIPTNIALQKLSIKNAEEEAAALAALNVARKAAIGLIAAIGAALFTAIAIIKRHSEEARKTTDTINAALSKLSVTMADFEIGTGRVESAFVKMKNAEGDATEETKAFNKSVDDLKKQFPKFIDDHIKMAQTVDDLGKYWAQARLEMNQYYADEARDRVDADLRQSRDSDTQEIERKVTRWIQRNISRKEWNTSGKYLTSNLMGYVRGDIDEENIYSFVDILGRMMFGEKSYNNDSFGYYKEKILSVLREYKNAYKAIIDEFKKASEEADRAVAGSNLTTTRSVINGAVGDRDLQMSASEDIAQYAKRLRDIYNSPETKDSVKEAIAGIFEEFSKTLGALSREPSDWVKDVNKIIRGFNATSEGNTLIKELDETAVQTEVIEQWKKDLDEVQASLAVIPLKYRNLENQTYVDLKARQSLLELISQELYENKTFNGATKVAKRETKDAIANIKQQYEELKELKEWYDKYAKLLNADGSRFFTDAQINSILTNFYGRGIPASGFSSAFDSIANQLEGEGLVNDARDVRNFAAGRDVGQNLASAEKKIENLQKAVKAYRDIMSGWVVGSELDGEGAEFKLSKIVSDYGKALDKITEKADDARVKLNEKADAERGLGIWSALGYSRDFMEIGARERRESGSALATYSEKGREAIKKMYDEWRNGAMDFNNLSDKTISQLRDMKASVDAFSADNADVFTPEVLANLKTLGIDLGEISKILARLKKQDLGKLDSENTEKLKKEWQYIAEEILSCADAVKDYADAVGNDDLFSAMEGIAGFAGAAKASLEGFRSGGVLGAIMGGVSSLFQNLMNAFTEAEMLKRAIREAAIEAERFRAEESLTDGVDTIFGENVSARLRNAMSIIRQYQSMVSADGRGKYKSIVWKSGLFGWDRSSKSLSEMVRELGYDLYDSYGNLNATALQAILDTYGKLTSESREWIENAIKDSEIYADAMEQLKDSMADIYGGLVDDVTNQIIEGWRAASSAALDYTDILDDVATHYAQMIIKDAIIDKIFTPEVEKMISDLAGSGDTVGALELTRRKLDEVRENQEEYNLILDGLGDYMKKNSDASDTLSGGIKSITEDTANLLASYLNAIRADVSYGKTQWERIAVAVEGHTTQYITLNDYMMQVQANTANIAESNRRILQEMQGFIRDFSLPSGYGESLKVQIVN